MIKEDPKKPGTYIVSYGKRHPVTRYAVTLRRKGFKSMAEARRAHNNLVLQVEGKIKEVQVPRWSTLLEDHLRVSRARGLAEKTVIGYELTVKKHTLESWGERFVDSISTDEIRELIRVRVGHMSPSQQKYLLKGIRGVFNHAVETRVIPSNPTPIMKFKIGDRIKKVLTQEQASELLEKAKQYGWEWYPHYAVALYTGMRNGELYALAWEQVDLDNRKIIVDRSWNNRDGFKCTKSGDDRVVEIAPALVPVLQELKLKSASPTFVLPRNPRWNKGEQARELRIFLQGINLPQIRFHDLRATWATLLLSKGIEPIKVMCMGGWKDLKTMMIYVRKAGVDIRGAMDVLALHDHHQKTGKLLHLTDRL